MPDQEVSLHLAAVADRLASAVAGAALVLTHAFEGGHSDHDAVAFAVHAAVRTHAQEALLAEMPFYHAGPDGWRRQVFLAHAAEGASGGGPERLLRLTAAERDLKARMVAAHRSQADVLRSFDLAVERFRVAPRYDFTHRPHDGDLLYEHHRWNLTWPDWVARVRAAKAVLGIGAP
jgi:N-acetylglucosamine malate deacetylase 2